MSCIATLAAGEDVVAVPGTLGGRPRRLAVRAEWAGAPISVSSPSQEAITDFALLIVSRTRSTKLAISFPFLFGCAPEWRD
jgi:hypothetical protein